MAGRRDWQVQLSESDLRLRCSSYLHYQVYIAVFNRFGLSLIEHPTKHFNLDVEEWKTLFGAWETYGGIGRFRASSLDELDDIVSVSRKRILA